MEADEHIINALKAQQVTERENNPVPHVGHAERPALRLWGRGGLGPHLRPCLLIFWLFTCHR